MRVNKRKMFALFVSTLLASSLVLLDLKVGMAHPTTIYVDPPITSVTPCTDFSVDISIDYVVDLFAFDFKLSFNPALLNCTGAVSGGFLTPPTLLPSPIIDNNAGYVRVGDSQLFGSGTTGGSPPPLATVYFHCEGVGDSALHLNETALYDSYLTLIPHGTTDGWVSQEFPMYWKANYTDYAPSGVPDFDQRQMPHWNGTGIWSWCAPTAAANSLSWMDSRYENSTTPPPTVNDTFPLVSSYGPWDDHDPNNTIPLIDHLGHLMDTDGVRTGIPHIGTRVNDTQTGIAHYLSWTGVNPQGDVNGDGIVNQTDVNLVNAAFGSSVVGGVPSPNWNMAADIWPVTTGWPNVTAADNKVDMFDVQLVAANMNSTGMFYEKTVQAPDFYFVEEEVERCEDVILVLGFYYGLDREDYPYPYGSGHMVTVAGVNSTTMQIAISDPIQDNAEPPPRGTNGPGRVLPPPPHPHLPVPPYPLHNNASYVSQDIYNVTWTPPGIPANFTLVNYTSPQYPGFPPPMAVVEWAITVSPTGYVPQKPPCVYPVTWKWLNSTKDPVWLTANVTILSDYAVGNFNFNRSLGQISFDVTSATSGSCNVTVPKLLMDGAFKVFINSTQVPCMLTWNKSYTFVYFTCSQGINNVKIIGEIVTRIRTDLFIADVNGDGKVTITDIVIVALRFGWEEDC